MSPIPHHCILLILYVRVMIKIKNQIIKHFITDQLRVLPVPGKTLIIRHLTFWFLIESFDHRSGKLIQLIWAFRDFRNAGNLDSVQRSARKLCLVCFRIPTLYQLNDDNKRFIIAGKAFGFWSKTNKLIINSSSWIQCVAIIPPIFYKFFLIKKCKIFCILL